ncbi:MAG TPA: aminopeptidase P family protein [Candidatus Fimimonas merdipullorum]|uniref:Aminopeptidase P family protein n=1 Tax=Candidatus Fimimonas merdipullorum TaxID=2840822 RepID=A0A9D1SPJ9_9BACT|nr:aminopeptidase P family protein [Candidatus Fimimonas merdipullorum]
MKDLKTLFQRCGADALVVISDKNRLYFTGFASTFGYLVLTKDKSIFITDPRYFEMAQSLEEKGIEVRQIANGVSATALLVSVLKDIGAKTVGYEDTELTVNQFQTLQKELAEFTLLPCGGDVNYVRSFKDEEEISLIRKAQSVTDAAFKQLLKVIRAGMTEIDIRVELEYLLAKNGGEGLAFDTIVASGVNTSKPHAHPTDKVVENGDAVTMDFGARYHGYCSDMTRTVFVGEPVAEMRKIYNVVLMAQRNGIANAHCGMTGRELDSYCREVIKANGYEKYFTHSTGHSLGIDIHEEPRASMYSDQPLLANQLITCEPGIYVPGVGGVRIEDLLLVQEEEVIDLTTSEKDIIIL